MHIGHDHLPAICSKYTMKIGYHKKYYSIMPRQPKNHLTEIHTVYPIINIHKYIRIYIH